MKGGFSTVSWPIAMIRSAAVYCPMHIVPLRERGGTHVEPGSAGDRTLAHLRVEERDLQALHEIGQRVSQVRTACSRTQHHQRPLGLEDQLGRTIQCCARRNGPVDRVRRDGRNCGSGLAGNVFRQLEMDWPWPLLLCHRNASRTIEGMVTGLTI